jgi:aspartate/methionine/tyrosine aminotransferase
VVSFLNEGDEVCTIEPFFGPYKQAADVVGATTIGVPLRPRNGASPTMAEDFVLDLEELRSVLTPKTKMLILNTPHNPTGKVFSTEELKGIADVVRSFPHLMVISDEVYECSTFLPKQHERFANVDDDMWERTISMYSAGKTFSCTGWRIGYAVGPSSLLAPLISAQGVMSYCAATPLEVAVGYSLEEAKSNGYFNQVRDELQQKQSVLVDALKDTPLSPIVADGGYFLMVDTSSLVLPDKYEKDLQGRDFGVAKYLTEKYKVTGLPTKPFYSKENQHLSDNVLRFCFARTSEELEEAGRRLKKLSTLD